MQWAMRETSPLLLGVNQPCYQSTNRPLFFCANRDAHCILSPARSSLLQSSRRRVCRPPNSLGSPASDHLGTQTLWIDRMRNVTSSHSTFACKTDVIPFHQQTSYSIRVAERSATGLYSDRCSAVPAVNAIGLAHSFPAPLGQTTIESVRRQTVPWPPCARDRLELLPALDSRMRSATTPDRPWQKRETNPLGRAAGARNLSQRLMRAWSLHGTARGAGVGIEPTTLFERIGL